MKKVTIDGKPYLVDDNSAKALKSGSSSSRSQRTATRRKATKKQAESPPAK